MLPDTFKNLTFHQLSRNVLPLWSIQFYYTLHERLQLIPVRRHINSVLANISVKFHQHIL